MPGNVIHPGKLKINETVSGLQNAPCVLVGDGGLARDMNTKDT